MSCMLVSIEKSSTLCSGKKGWNPQRRVRGYEGGRGTRAYLTSRHVRARVARVCVSRGPCSQGRPEPTDWYVWALFQVGGCRMGCDGVNLEEDVA